MILVKTKTLINSQCTSLDASVNKFVYDESKKGNFCKVQYSLGEKDGETIILAGISVFNGGANTND